MVWVGSMYNRIMLENNCLTSKKYCLICTEIHKGRNRAYRIGKKWSLTAIYQTGNRFTGSIKNFKVKHVPSKTGVPEKENGMTWDSCLLRADESQTGAKMSKWSLNSMLNDPSNHTKDIIIAFYCCVSTQYVGRIWMYQRIIILNIEPICLSLNMMKKH